jgi:hypothetical protein
MTAAEQPDNKELRRLNYLHPITFRGLRKLKKKSKQSPIIHLHLHFHAAAKPTPLIIRRNARN